MSALAEVMRIYRGSDGKATRDLYDRLTSRGPRGVIAAFLMRAQKNSERAKVYRGRGYRDAAYDRKQWALDQLAAALALHGSDLRIEWGWGEDPAQEYHRHVLYVELPLDGQVSFHTDVRGHGPEAPKPWDGQRGMSPQRICTHVARVLEHLERFEQARDADAAIVETARAELQREVNPDGSLTLSWAGKEGDA